MASQSPPPPQQPPAALHTTLPSRPASARKKPRLPPGARVIARRLETTRPNAPHRRRRTSPSGGAGAAATGHRIVIGRGTHLSAVARQVEKLLERGPGGAASAAAAAQGLAGSGSGVKGKQRAAAGDEDQEHAAAVVVVGAGALNIEKALKTAAAFQRRGDCVVRIYTNTVSGVDTYALPPDDGATENDTGAEADTECVAGSSAEPWTSGARPRSAVRHRSRMASTLEVAIRLK